MSSKVIFNMDSRLKAAAMKKAKIRGLTLSAVLNLATRSFVGGELEVGAFSRELEKARAEARRGKLVPQERLFKELGF